EKLERRPETIKLSRRQRRSGVSTRRGADHHFGNVEIDAILDEPVEEPAVPGNVIFTTTTEHQGSVEPFRQIRNRGRTRYRADQAIVREQSVGNSRGHYCGVI